MTKPTVSRRAFVRATALTGAAVAAGTRLSAQTAPMVRRFGLCPQADDAGVKLGVASYSLRNFPRDQVIEMTRSLGVRYINLKSVHLGYDAAPTEFAAARAELSAAGLELVGGGMITFETDTDDGVRRYFDYAKAAGMPLIVFTAKPSVLPRIEKFAMFGDGCGACPF